MRAERIAGRGLLYLAVILIVGYSLFPIYWMIISALKPSTELFKYPPALFTLDLTLENFFKLFTMSDFPHFFRNSCYVSICTILITISIASIGAYGLTRFRLRGGETYARVVLFVYMVPPVLLVIPLYIIMVRLHLGNTLTALILVCTAMALPLSLWLLRTFFQAVPVALEEAALIDGANRFQVILHVFLPLALPGLVATSTFVLAVVWNEYIFALIFISSSIKKTIPVGLTSFITEHDILWEYLLPGSVMAIIPIAIVFLFSQRYLIEGWGTGAVKG